MYWSWFDDEQKEKWDDMFDSQQMKDKKKVQETNCDRQKQTKLAHSTSQYYFVLQSSHKVRPSSTSYYKACTKYVPARLRTIKLATKYVPVLLRTTKLATKYFPVLLRTTKLAQSTSQYYFALQSLHKVRPSTTSYYQACTKYFPARLRTIKLATKYVPWLLRTTKLATKYFPVLLRTTKLAQSTSKSQFYLSFWRSNLEHWNRNFTSVFDDRTSFRAKGLRPTA